MNNMIEITKEIVLHFLKHTDVEVFVYDEIDSTNNVARQLFEENYEKTALIVTGHQSAGRGRRGHSFFSPEGGLYFTLAYQPKNPDLTIQKLTVASGVASVQGIEDVTGISADIKWVNDIYLSGKKTGGILCEAPRHKDGSLAGVMSGIGINCFQKEFPQELKDKACALNVEGLDRNALCAAVADHLLDWADKLDSEELMEIYRKHSFLLGKEVSFMDEGVEKFGIAVDVNFEGNLIIRLSDGTIASINSGEVSLSSWKR